MAQTLALGVLGCGMWYVVVRDIKSAWQPSPRHALRPIYRTSSGELAEHTMRLPYYPTTHLNKQHFSQTCPRS